MREMKSVCVFVVIWQISNCRSQNLVNNNDVLEGHPFRRLFRSYDLDNLNFKVSEKCESDILLFLDEAKTFQLWALKMLDASSKISSGILEGNILNYGGFDECISINEYIDDRNILGQYCLVGIGSKRNQTTPVTKDLTNPDPEISIDSLDLKIAICLPHTCSNEDINTLFNQINMSAAYMENNCQTQNSFNIDNTSLSIMIFFGLMILVVITSSAYDYLTESFYHGKSNVLLSAFSVFKNWKKIFNHEDDPNDISCIHGFRVLSMAWVMCHHLFVQTFSYNQLNFVDTIKRMNNHEYDFFYEAQRAVDTFFVLSGIVLSYVFLSSGNTKFNWCTFYLHRYLRLTPTLAAVILFHVGLMKFVSSGPLWLMLSTTFTKNCEKYWWQTILYINNYDDDKCIDVSWYLSVEMQLYVFSPVLLLLLQKKPKVALWLIGFLVVCVIITCFTVTWVNNLDSFLPYMELYYLPTYTRAAPWLLGIATGYLIFKTKQRQTRIVINWVLVTLLWSVTFAFVLFASFYLLSSFDQDISSKLKNYFDNSLMRSIWSIAVAWIVYACYFGYGGPINLLLSLPVFKVLSRLSFSSYIIHTTVIAIFFGRVRGPLFFSLMELFSKFWIVFMYSVLGGIVLTLMFEIPFITIDKTLFGKRKQKGEK